MSKLPPLIALEEHYLFEGDEKRHNQSYDKSFPDTLVDNLREISHDRIAKMDAGGITVQVLSHSPGALSPESCQATNDYLAAAVKKNPTRFRGFATLSMDHPDIAAQELKRCVETLGFHGALIEDHLPTGEFYDDERFWPVFDVAQKLDVPIYIHPSFPAPSTEHQFRGNFGRQVEAALGRFAWGWHSSVALHVLRLFAAGLFERFPKLKIIIGHSSEGLSFFLERIQKFTKSWPLPDGRPASERQKTIRQVWDENLWVTTSGMFALGHIACLLQNTKVERIMFSVDYPFATNEEGREFMEELAVSGLVSPEQLELIAYKNAERLLRLPSVELRH